jgi:hypothetical protein
MMIGCTGKTREVGNYIGPGGFFHPWGLAVLRAVSCA